MSQALMADDGAIERRLSGQELAGDDLSTPELARWREQTDAFHRVQRPAAYPYAAFDRFHVMGTLLKRRYDCCLALGCGSGEELLPLAGAVDRFIAVEPIESLWRAEIGGRPVRYLAPSVSGDLPLEPGSVDLVIAFDVLHHIANVSHVLGEIARVLEPGGLLAVRDPISWMGDWRQPRPGLTPVERGLPLAWFEQAAAGAGLRVLRRHLCLFAPLLQVLSRAGFRPPLARGPLVLIDWLISESMGWNVRYRRQGALGKLAPSSAVWLLQRA